MLVHMYHLFISMVAGKPCAPEGPLAVSDITAESCKLTWKQPKDCGGSPVTHYIVEKMDTSDGVWKKVTKFCRGTTYEPSDLINGELVAIVMRVE